MLEDMAQLLDLAAAMGWPVSAWVLATARVLPSALLVPAFGLGGLPLLCRVVLGFSFALTLIPALEPSGSLSVWRVTREAVHGLPIAVATAAWLWAALTAGGWVDELLGPEPRYALDGPEASSGPMATLLGLGCVVSFYQLDGPARLLEALLSTGHGDEAILSMGRAIAGGLQLALRVAAPLVAVSLVLRILAALMTRGALGSAFGTATRPWEKAALWLVSAAFLDRLLAAFTQRLPLP